MYRDTNRQVLEEIGRLNSLKSGKVIGRNESKKTTVTSLGKFYSEVAKSVIYIGLKEYYTMKGEVLNIRIGAELGLIDLVEKEIPSVVEEFPLFHGVFLDANGEPMGVITEDYSKNGAVLVKTVGCGDSLPYEIQGLLGRPNDLDELATTCFLVEGKRRIGDFGEFTRGTVNERSELAKNYLDTIKNYSVRVPLKG